MNQTLTGLVYTLKMYPFNFAGVVKEVHTYTHTLISLVWTQLDWHKGDYISTACYPIGRGIRYIVIRHAYTTITASTLEFALI